MALIAFADIEEQYLKDEQLKRGDVAKLEEWHRMQPHLPAVIHPIETVLFLQSCYFNNEMAKQCTDNYFTLRTLCPEFFTKRDPFGTDVQAGLDTCLFTVLPDLTPEGYMIFYSRLLDRNPNKYDFNVVCKIFDMMMDLENKRNGCQAGFISVLDLEGATMAHLLKCNMLSVKKSLVYLQTGLPIRLKGFHYVNAPSFMDKILALVKPLVRKDLQSLLYTHYGDNHTIFEYVPKDILPIECGGYKFCATDYYKNVSRKLVENHAEYFKMDEKRVVDESRRPGKAINHGNLFGVDGTFKKLDID